MKPRTTAQLGAPGSKIFLLLIHICLGTFRSVLPTSPMWKDIIQQPLTLCQKCAQHWPALRPKQEVCSILIRQCQVTQRTQAKATHDIKLCLLFHPCNTKDAFGKIHVQIYGHQDIIIHVTYIYFTFACFCKDKASLD